MKLVEDLNEIKENLNLEEQREVHNRVAEQVQEIPKDIPLDEYEIQFDKIVSDEIKKHKN